MSRFLWCGWPVFLLLCMGLDTAGAADVQPLETVPGWGLVVDPVGDCTFHHDVDEFTIKVPGTYHDLWPIKGQVNAPLVLQEVEGDFTVEVLIVEVSRAEPNTVLPGMASTVSFHAGTLLIWQDSRNFVRLEKTDMHKAPRRHDRGGKRLPSGAMWNRCTSSRRRLARKGRWRTTRPNR